MNNKGQIIITDILLYLIILTIILGIIVYAVETVNDNQINRLNNKEINNLLEDSLSTLTKTSGTPDNWEKINTQNIKTIGLKSNNNKYISYDKLNKLKNNKELLNNNFPETIEYTLTLYPKNNKDNIEHIAGKNNISNRKQVYAKEVPIIIDYDFKLTSLKEKTDETCVYNHDNQWTCTSITISKTLLEQGEYYIITDSNTNYILTNTYSENITGQTNNKIKINNQLQQLKKNENQTITIHTKTVSNNTCLVYDKNNREKYLGEVLKPEVYILNMKIAR